MTTYYLKAKEWFDKQPQAEKDKLPALLAGVGLALILSQSIGVTGRPVAGYVLIALSLVVALLLGKKITLGPKYMWIPLVVIMGVVLLRGILYDVSVGTFEIGFISLMFAGYLAGRVCGRQLFFLLPIIVITLSFFIYIDAILRPGMTTGGIMDPRNYNLSVAVLIFGTILTTWKRKWIVMAIALPAIFLTGASEGILVVAVIAILALMRKDWSHRLWLPAGALSIVFLATFYTGMTDTLYARAHSILTDTTESSAVTERIDGYKLALTDFRFLGHGYNPTLTQAPNYDVRSIHNVPLRALYELGPIVALAWCYAMLVGCIKTKYKYAFAAILAFSLVDHLMWTWLAPVPWIIAGVATVDREGDLLFRKEKEAI